MLVCCIKIWVCTLFYFWIMLQTCKGNSKTYLLNRKTVVESCVARAHLLVNIYINIFSVKMYLNIFIFAKYNMDMREYKKLCSLKNTIKNLNFVCYLLSVLCKLNDFSFLKIHVITRFYCDKI
jgi:hypothetical protein